MGQTKIKQAVEAGVSEQVRAVLVGNPGLSVAEIITRVDRGQASVYKALKRMEHDGCLLRARGEPRGYRGHGYLYFASERDLLVWELERRL